MNANYPRDAAVRVLTRVLSDKQPLDEALGQVSGEVSPEARAWLQEVCSGTLRWKGRLDLILDSNSLKKKPSGWLRKILLVGVYQLVVMDRAQPGRVVSETVDEVKRREGEPPARFANALLRKVSDHVADWKNFEFPMKGTPAECATWASLPLWLWTEIERDHGREWARAYAQASLERPVLWLRARTSDGVEKFAKPGPVPESWRVEEAPRGAIPGWPGFGEGLFFVQDISSQILVSEVTGEVKRALGSDSVSALDLCAAPGGKSVGMAWSGQGGIKVTASDRDETRLALLRQTVERVAPESSRGSRGVNVIPKSEVEKLPLQDLVWVDSPCSGSGILRRHPDVRWLREERELAGLLKVQQEILLEGWSKVREGGFLAWSVCSVLKKEGPGALERAGLSSRIIKTWFLVPQSEPQGDGFWCALLKKS